MNGFLSFVIGSIAGLLLLGAGFATVDNKSQPVKTIAQQRVESTGIALPQGNSIPVQRYRSTHPIPQPSNAIAAQQAKALQLPGRVDGQGNWIPPGGKVVTEDQRGYVVSRTYDIEGKLISTMETTIGARSTMPTSNETEGSLQYIKYGARNKEGSNLNTAECSWTASNPTNNFNCPEYWLRSDVIDAYCAGVMESAYRKHGMEYPSTK